MPDPPDGCVLLLEEEPAFPDTVHVHIAGVEVPHITDCVGEQGWSYTNDDGPYDAIALCGLACADLQRAGEATVAFFCVE